MTELSLHILDIMQNSIVAGASLVRLDLVENTKEDYLEFCISDNGKGMSPEFLAAVTDPFTTSRTTRKVGLGIPLLKAATEATGGYTDITSVLGEGTSITARFGYSHIDRQPLGDMAETMLGLLTSYETTDFLYHHQKDDSEYTLDTREIRGILGDVSFKEPDVTLWLSEFLKENEAELY